MDREYSMSKVGPNNNSASGKIKLRHPPPQNILLITTKNV